MSWSRGIRLVFVPSLILASFLAAACGSNPAAPGAPDPRILSFEADPPRLDGPGEVTLSWRTADAASVQLRLDGAPIDADGLEAAEGSHTLHLEATATVGLEAWGADGAVATEALTVEVEEAPPAPTMASFTGPGAVELDEGGTARATLRWSGVQHAEELWLEATTLAPIALDPAEAEGSVEVELVEDTTFTLIASNEAGEASLGLSVEVIPLPSILHFESDRSRVGSGEKITIGWATEDSVAVALLLNGEVVEGWEDDALEGEWELPILLESRLELIASNILGTEARASLDVEVGQPLLTSFIGSSQSLWLGEELELRWQSLGASELIITEEGSGTPLHQSADLAFLADGRWTWSPAAAGAYDLQLSLTNSSGVNTARWSFRADSGPSIVHFSAAPLEVTEGEAIALSWEVRADPDGTPADLELSDDRGGSYSAGGSIGAASAVAAGPGPMTFTLRASTEDPRSLPAEASVQVEVEPQSKVTLTASPTHFDDSVDEVVQLSWTTADAVAAHIEWIVDGEVQRLLELEGDDLAAGFFDFAPTQAGLLRLEAVNSLGHRTIAEEAITVAPTEVLAFRADPTSTTQGEAVVLEWQTRMADEVRLDVAQGAYLREELPTPYLDAAYAGGSRLPLTDECGEIATAGCATLTFPFTFPFGDSVITAARVYTVGVISFDTASHPSIAANEAFPSGSSASWVHLAPFWDSLRWDPARYPEGNVYTLHLEEEGKRSLVIQWRDIGFAQAGAQTASLSFEVVLHEDGRFEYRYGPTSERDATNATNLLTGSSATIGYQLLDQGAADTLQHQGTLPLLGAPSQRTFGFRPTPILAKSGSLRFHPYPERESLPLVLTAIRGGQTHSQTVTLEVARKPLVHPIPFEPTPSLVDEPFRLGWQTFNAERVEVVDAADRLRCEATSPAAVAESFCEIVESEVGVYSYRVRAIAAGGAVGEVSFHQMVYAPFGILSFEADETEVEVGQPVSLSWETFGGAELRLLADGVELLREADPAGPGSFLIEGVERNTEYVLELSNDIGVVEERRLTVEIWEVEIDLVTSATTVRPGEPIEVTIDASFIDGGAPAPIFGNLPLVEVSAPYVDISTLEGAFDHFIPGSVNATNAVVELTFPEGFSFPYMGTVVTGAQVFMDGYLSFDLGSPITRLNQRLPFAGTPEGRAVHLAPFWDDLTAWNHGKIWTAMLDADTFVIQWTEVTVDWASTAIERLNLSFQVVLHRSGAFEFRYGQMLPHVPPYTTHLCYPGTCENEANGSSATIGFQWNDGRSGQTLHFGGTSNGPLNPPVRGGLSNRSFRYEPFTGQRTFQVRTDVSQTLEFCSISAGQPVCKELEVVVTPFGLDSFMASAHEVTQGTPITLSWKSRGGTHIDLRKNGDIVHTVTELEAIDEGSWTDTPTSNTVYTLELWGGSHRRVVSTTVDVLTMTLSASISPSAGPGAPVTLSWDLQVGDPSLQPIVATPMEETTGGAPFFDLSIAVNPDDRLIGANANTNTVEVVFDDFVFPYFGVEYDRVRVTTDGYLTFDSTAPTSSNGTNQLIPNANATYRRMHLAPFWDDLHTRQSGGVFGKKVDADTYVFEWNQISLNRGSSNSNEGNLNFLVILRRDGTFEYHYGPMQRPPQDAAATTFCNPVSCENESNGSAATIGYQNPDGTLGYLLHFGGTNPGAANQPVLGGLGHRSWRFTPHRASGSIQLNPTERRTYTICAIDPETGDSICAPTLEAEVPWGIDLFEATPRAPLQGENVSLSWKVMGLDSMRILANDVELASYQGAALPSMGTLTHQLLGPTHFVLEGDSLGREVRAEQTVVPRTLDLQVTAPSGRFLLGETVEIGWQATNVSPGSIAVVSPLSEVAAGPGSPHAFLDVSGLPGAEVVEMSGVNGFGTVALPFTFPYLGAAQQSLEVFVDGYLSFAGAGGNSLNSHRLLPEADNKVHMAVYWKNTEMDPEGPERIWKYAPDPDTLIIQWKNFNSIRGSTASSRYDLNFQVVLRSNGSFEYRYGEMKPPPPPHSSPDCAPTSCWDDANGQHASIGYQTADGALGTNLHFGTLEPPPSGFGMISLTPPAGIAFPGGLSHRSFVYTPTTSGTAQVVVGRSGSQQVCATLDGYVACESVRVETMVDPGEVAITELMIDPSLPAGGQWFEVRNLSHRPVDLQGFTVRSLSSAHVIASSLPIAPGAFVTLATPGAVGFVPDYLLDESFELDTLSDRLELQAGAMTVASVGWGITWGIPQGASLSLDPRHHETGRVDHSDPEEWCDAGPAGNPGSIGDACSDANYRVDPRSSRPFIDIAATGSRLHDVEGTGVLGRVPTAGFMPRFFGSVYSRVWAASNGWISFADDVPTLTPNQNLPNDLPRNTANLRGPLLSAFWDKLSCDRSAYDCRFYYELREAEGSEVFILQWDGYRLNNGELTFQVQLWEEGDIVVAFPPLENSFGVGTTDWFGMEGGTSWIGLEADDPTNFVTAHWKRILHLSQRSIHFEPR